MTSLINFMTKQVKLYEIPKVLETAAILDDSVLDAYNDSIKGFNEKARITLGKFGKADGELTGSNPFMLVHLANSGLLPAGSRLAIRPDLEKAISFDSDFLAGRYADFGLALRTAGDSYTPNDLLTKILAKQLEQRNIKLGNGKLIYLNALTIPQDDDSAYGLVFDLKDNAKELIRDIEDFKWNYTRQEGLVGAYLNGDGGWYSDYGDLADSNCDGRVVPISAEGKE